MATFRIKFFCLANQTYRSEGRRRMWGHRGSTAPSSLNGGFQGCFFVSEMGVARAEHRLERRFVERDKQHYDDTDDQAHVLESETRDGVFLGC